MLRVKEIDHWVFREDRARETGEYRIAKEGILFDLKVAGVADSTRIAERMAKRHPAVKGGYVPEEVVKERILEPIIQLAMATVVKEQNPPCYVNIGGSDGYPRRLKAGSGHDDERGAIRRGEREVILSAKEIRKWRLTSEAEVRKLREYKYALESIRICLDLQGSATADEITTGLMCYQGRIDQVLCEEEFREFLYPIVQTAMVDAHEKGKEPGERSLEMVHRKVPNTNKHSRHLFADSMIWEIEKLVAVKDPVPAPPTPYSWAQGTTYSLPQGTVGSTMLGVEPDRGLEAGATTGGRCECGAAVARTPHSHWCPAKE